MSVLERPQIFIRGEVAWDPIVTNNFATMYDETSGTAKFPEVANRVAAFRQAAIEKVTPADGNWNPHGTHRSTFQDTTVCGTTMRRSSASDSFLNAPVRFTGMLVDLEPFGGFTSQLFFDQVKIGIDGGPQIVAPRSARMTARFLNMQRNMVDRMIASFASVVWQTTFAKEAGLRVVPSDSLVLKELAAALESDDVLGLTIRFNTYGTFYFGDPTLTKGAPQTGKRFAELREKLGRGGFQPSPARSRVVGVVGLWRRGEPVHEPGERRLVPVGESKLATAFLHCDRERLTVDLSNTIPEEGRDLPKQDLGPLHLVALDPRHGMKRLATLTYDQYRREAYEATAGIVSIPLPRSVLKRLEQTDIALVDSGDAVLLQEQRLSAVLTPPNLYVDEGDRASMRIQVYDRGKPLATQVPFQMVTMTADGDVITDTRGFTTDSTGSLELWVDTSIPGIRALLPLVEGSGLPLKGLSSQIHTYAYVRTRPSGADVKALPPTWDNVYAAVLAHWNAMAPCMDNWLRLDDPDQVRAFADVIRTVTDPTRIDEFTFMPVTRDMTAGQRALLYKFLEQPASAVDGARSQSSRSTALSRAQRQNTELPE